MEISVGTYSLGAGGWTAKVRLAPQGKHYARWHIPIVDPGGAAGEGQSPGANGGTTES